MFRRDFLGTALSAGSFACVCSVGALAQTGRPFCTFSKPGAPIGGLSIRSYDLKPGGGRPKSQLSYSVSGSLTGVGNPTAICANAFAAWRAPRAAPALGFQRINGAADIRMTVGDLGGADASGLTILAQTTDDGRSIVFNSRSSWTPALLLQVATHEIGHALGLLHATTNNSVMYPIANGVTIPSADDCAAIRALYGWTPQRSVEGWTDGGGPAVCSCGNTLARAWRGAGNDKTIWFSTSVDGKGWTPQRPLPGVASDVGPSLAWDGGRLWIAWRGAGNNNLNWANTTDFFTRNGSGVKVLGDRASSHAPRLALANGTMYMAWKGSRDDQGLYYATFSGSAWTPQIKINGVGSLAAPAICQDLDARALRMVWRGVKNDDALYTSTLSDLFWQPQQQVSWIETGNGNAGTSRVGVPGSADGPNITNTGDKLVMLWRGVPGDDGLYMTQFAADLVGGRQVNEWSAQAKVPKAGSAFGPGVAAFNGAIHSVWRGARGDAQLWTAVL